MAVSGRVVLRVGALMLVILHAINLASAGENKRRLPVRGNFFAGQKCSPSWSGRLTFNGRTRSILACYGQRWTHVSSQTWRGAGNYKTCYDVLKEGGSYGDGFYFLTEPTSGEKYRAYCDMTTDGGGWTLFATKALPKKENSFLDTFSVRSADAISHDAAGCIPTHAKWREVLFRFKNDDGASRLVFSRYLGGGSTAKTRLIDLITCGGGYPKDIAGDTPGFYKHTPYEQAGRRVPVSNFYTIRSFIVYRKNGLSETHGGSDKWLDLWHARDGGNSYYKSDSSNAQGTKCIAGVCYEKDPVWIMYR